MTNVPGSMTASYMSRPAYPDRILVVDDSPDNVFLIQAILEEEGYKISTAADGRSALAQIEQSPPDLVLLDVMMPGMDGYEVTQRIRDNTALPFIPILLITAYDQPSVAQGLDTGADDFIRKPVEVDELLARVRALLRLKHSVDERDAIARQRADFVSWLAHDLRTPLIAADRMLNLMQQGALGELSAEMQEVISTMARSNQNLLAMANNLLEVYRYEAGRKTLSFSPIDLEELFKELIQELTPLAHDKKLALNLELGENSDGPNQLMVEGDRLELRRVFTNIIGNAIKFTDSGSVDVRLLRGDRNGKPSNRQVTVEIQDTGPGIAPEDQALLFERFRQGRHQRAGSGLGLHLSKRILEAHQGKIQVKSEVGKGSLFLISLPVKHSDKS